MYDTYWLVIHYIVIHSFHDGNLNFYRPDTVGYYSGRQITGLTSTKVSVFFWHLYSNVFYIYITTDYEVADCMYLIGVVFAEVLVL